MTRAEIEDTIDLMRAAGRNTIPISLTEWREWMTTKSIGRVDKAALAKGKVKPADSTPAPMRGAKARKAARIEKGLRANRAKSAKSA